MIKTRLALQGSETGPHKQYTGMINAFLTISREEGLRGLYKGLVPALFLTSHGAIQVPCRLIFALLCVFVYVDSFYSLLYMKV